MHLTKLSFSRPYYKADRSMQKIFLNARKNLKSFSLHVLPSFNKVSIINGKKTYSKNTHAISTKKINT